MPDIQGMLALLEKPVVSSLDDTFEELRSQLQAMLDDLKFKDKLLVRDAFNLSKIDSFTDQLRDALGEAGFNDVVGEQLSSMKQLVDQVKAEAKDMNLSTSFSQMSQQQVESLLTKTTRATFNLAEDVATDIEELLQGSMTGTADFGKINNSITRILKVRKDQAVSLTTTSLSNFHRQTRTTHFTESGIKWWAYEGPLGGSIRPFCARCVDRRFTSSMLEALAGDFGRDDKLIPVMVWLGGYRCRHRLDPILDEDLDDYEVGAR